MSFAREEQTSMENFSERKWLVIFHCNILGCSCFEGKGLFDEKMTVYKWSIVYFA